MKKKKRKFKKILNKIVTLIMLVYVILFTCWIINYTIEFLALPYGEYPKMF